MTENKTYAIVGGGPGGLTLARLLQKNGLRVQVYERDESRNARMQGATLDLHAESGLKALHHAGLMEEFRARYRPGADKLLLVDRDANLLLDEFASGDLGEERPEIDRGPLRDLLLDSLEPDTVHWRCRCTALTPLNSSGVRLEFASGISADADVVIGADGANSQVRAHLTPVKPVYSGVTVIEGSVCSSEHAAPQVRKRCGIGKVCALGDAKTIIVGAKGDGSLSFYTGHNAPEHWALTSGINFSTKAEVLRWFTQEFAGWNSLWMEMFEDADPVFVPRPQYFLPQEPGWEPRPNMTLLGDAAHVMPPYTGEGVNQAMLDAWELAERLTSTDAFGIPAAIAAYEAKMRPRVAAEIRMAVDQTKAFHSPNAAADLVELFASYQAEKSAKN